MVEHRLWIGARLTSLRVRPDRRYPQLYRIHWAGEVFDLVNLSRAKEAAIGWPRPRGLGGDEVARWERRETAQDGPPMR